MKEKKKKIKNYLRYDEYIGCLWALFRYGFSEETSFKEMKAAIQKWCATYQAVLVQRSD
jgi:hypothetical protein